MKKISLSKSRFSIDEIEPGISFSQSHQIKEEDIHAFAEISGDKNPVHLDNNYAKGTRFKKRIAHGLMSASFFSAIFGTKIPGEGCVYVSQTLKFLRPVYINDVVDAKVTVIDVFFKRNVVKFKTECFVDEKKVISGIAELYVPPK